MVLPLLSPARLRVLGGACLRNPGSLLDRHRKPRQLRSPSLPLSPPPSPPALVFDPSPTRRIPSSMWAKQLNGIDRLPLRGSQLRYPFCARLQHRRPYTPLPFDLHHPSTIQPRPRTARPAPPPPPPVPPPLLMPATPSSPTCTSSTSYPPISALHIAPYYDWWASTRRRSRRRIRTWPMPRMRTTSLCETRPFRSGISWWVSFPRILASACGGLLAAAWKLYPLEMKLTPTSLSSHRARHSQRRSRLTPPETARKRTTSPCRARRINGIATS